MTEKIFQIESIEPALFFGSSIDYLQLLINKFSTLKIVARGQEIKVSGTDYDIALFEQSFELLIQAIISQPNLSQSELNTLILGNTKIHETIIDKKTESDILVYGPNGKIIKARTPNQKKMVSVVEKNDIVFALGPAGTGKTYTAVAIAVRALKNKEIKRIILARPAVEAGESLGFLPGDLKEKIDPYLRPLYDALADMIPPDKYEKYIENRTIEVAPMAFMRGRTLDNCYVILDEAQNSTDTQLKMFLTRMGPNAKVIITGDLTQVDLPPKLNSGLKRAIKILENIKGIEVVRLEVEDVVRHKLVKEIIKAYEQSDLNKDK